MMFLWSLPASFVFVSFEPRLSRSRRFDSNGIGQKQTAARLEWYTNLWGFKIVQHLQHHDFLNEKEEV